MYSGASVPPGPRRGARDVLPGAVACQGTNLTTKRGPKAPFVAKFGVHLGKKFHVARGGRGVHLGPQNTELVVIRTLDSSQRDVPVYVVFLQGVLCLCQ